MRTLVTGGAGFIGSHTVDLLVEEGHDVTVLDNLDPQVHGEDADGPGQIAGHVGSGAVRFIRGDVRSRDDVARALEGVDRVIHLAAAVGVGQSMYEPHYYMDVNGSGQAMLMELMAADPGRWRRFVVASSMSIYGEGSYRCPEHGPVAPDGRSEERLERGEWEPTCPACDGPLGALPTPEEKPLRATSVYAISKKTQEELALCFAEAYGIPTAALRFFNVYGSRQALSNPYTGVAAIFMSRILNGRPPLIFEDGEQSRDFIHVADVARAVAAAAADDAPPAGVYNICTGTPTTIRGVAEVLAERLDSHVEPEVVGRYRAGDIRHCIGDPTRAAGELGFEARVPFREGVDELIAWARDEAPEDRVERSLEELETQGLVR